MIFRIAIVGVSESFILLLFYVTEYQQEFKMKRYMKDMYISSSQNYKTN